MTAAPASQTRPLPGIVAVGRQRSIVEVRTFFRNKSSLVFTLFFPVMLLVILGSIFGGEVGNSGVDLKQVLIAGIIAAGIMSVAFSGLAITMAIERGDGTTKRLAATPMPMASYFMGKAGLVLVTALVETVIIVIFATAALGLSLPSSASRWLTLLWVLILGATACALIGIAYSSLIPNPKSASAIVTPPFIALQFISGVFFPFGELPRWMQTVAAFFPLKWMAQGIRSVFLPDSFQSQEPAGSWEHGKTAFVLVLWCAIALVLCLKTFKWREE